MADIFDTVAGNSHTAVTQTAQPSGASAPSGPGYPQPVVPGNIQWYARPKVDTSSIKPGTSGTVLSMSNNEDGLEVLVPRIYEGKLHSPDEAWQHYRDTGQHMGKFSSVTDANAYGQKYHEDAQRGLYDAPASGRASGDIFDHVAAGAYDRQASTDNVQQPDPGMLDVANKFYESNPNDSTLSRVGKAIGRAGTAIPNLIHAIAAPPKDVSEAGLDRGQLAFKRIVYDPSEQAWNNVHQTADASRQKIEQNRQAGKISEARAKELQNHLNTWEKAGKALSVVPFIGPFALQEGKQAQAGDLAGTLTDLSIPIVAAGVGGFSSGAEGAEAGETAGESTAETMTKPGLMRQIMKGKNVAQPEAQAALRSVTSASEGTSLREVLSEPIEDAQVRKENLYRQYDDAAGVARKALQDRLQSTRDAMSKLTNTPGDLKRLARLKDAEASAKQLIADADAKAKAAGVNIADADAANVRLRALQEVEKNIFHNQDVIQGNTAQGAEESVNIDNAVKAIQKMQDNEKFGGPRFDQAFSSGSANRVLTQLRQYQAAGVHAVKVQAFAKILAKYGLPSAGAAIGGYEYLSSR